MMNPVQTKGDMAAKMDGLAHVFEGATATTRLVIEMPAADAAVVVETLRAAATVLRSDEAA